MRNSYLILDEFVSIMFDSIEEWFSCVNKSGPFHVLDFFASLFFFSDAFSGLSRGPERPVQVHP